MNAHDIYRAEEKRQADAYANAIATAINAEGKNFEAPILNAVAGGLAGCLVGVLCSIGNDRIRKSLHEKLLRAIDEGLIERAGQGGIMRVEIVVIGGARQ